VMVEHVETASGSVRLLPPRSASAGDNIVPQGAQARAGDELLAPGAAITFAQIALAAECGAPVLEVFRPPRVAILATGDELVPVEATPGPGQIRNSNAPMLAALVVAAGGAPWVLPAAADTADALDAALCQAATAEFLLISGGVSAGKFDLVEPALARLGAQFHFTGVRIQPGKPLVFGELPGLPFFGLPGNPVSSAVTFLAADTDRRAKPGLTRFLPASCTFSAGAGQLLPEVALIPWQGSGDLAALARSNCFLVIPEDTPTLEAGATVQILLP